MRCAIDAARRGAFIDARRLELRGFGRGTVTRTGKPVAKHG